MGYRISSISTTFSLMYVVFFIFFNYLAQAQNEKHTAFEVGTVAQLEQTQPIFNTQKPLEVSLSFDVKKLMRGKYKEDYQPATLVYQRQDEAGLAYDTVQLKIKARGNSRKRLCQFPPLKLNFAPKKTPQGHFSGLDKVKLVAYCKNSELYEQYILKEYYAYKLYEVFSNRTFKTRLLRVTYLDTKRKRKPVVRYGFLIEDEDEVVERLNVYTYETNQIHPNNCDKVATTTLALFQYMIGNTDWSVAKQHNIRLFVPDQAHGETRPFAIPYDFDHSGLVNAHYAIVSKTLPVNKVTERYYLGYCCEEEIVEEVVARFANKKDEVFEIFENDTFLRDKEKQQAINYLNDFYAKLEKPQQIKALLGKQCK